MKYDHIGPAGFQSLLDLNRYAQKHGLTAEEFDDVLTWHTPMADEAVVVVVLFQYDLDDSISICELYGMADGWTRYYRIHPMLLPDETRVDLEQTILDRRAERAEAAHIDYEVDRRQEEWA